MHEYDLIADWYASERVRTEDGSGVPEVKALASSLGPGARVLDIGCGNGFPLTRTLVESELRVVGLDSARAMLSRFKANCPDVPAVRGLAEACPFAKSTFDAAVAWGVMFHLTKASQVRAVANVSSVLKVGAPFLFTAGDRDDGDEHVGVMNGVQFRYYSFTVDGYRGLLAAHGFTLVDYHLDAGKNGYYLARKI